jgi:hypothetical protein
VSFPSWSEWRVRRSRTIVASTQARSQNSRAHFRASHHLAPNWASRRCEASLMRSAVVGLGGGLHLLSRAPTMSRRRLPNPSAAPCIRCATEGEEGGKGVSLRSGGGGVCSRG